MRVVSAACRVALLLAFFVGGLEAAAAPRPGLGGVGRAGREATGTRARGKEKTRRRSARRRTLFRGHAASPAQFRRGPLPRPSGKLHLYSVNYRDEVKVRFLRDDGSYDENAIRRLNHFVRARGAGTERAIEPRLYDLLGQVYDHYGGRVIELISGFRDQESTNSYHYLGSAIDFRVRGIPTRQLRSFVDTLDPGGMGLGIYPRTGFIHMDVRPEPSYRWIDYSGPNKKRKRRTPTS